MDASNQPDLAEDSYSVKVTDPDDPARLSSVSKGRTADYRRHPNRACTSWSN